MKTTIETCCRCPLPINDRTSLLIDGKHYHNRQCFMDEQSARWNEHFLKRGQSKAITNPVVERKDIIEFKKEIRKL